ncbi:hypothetical protein TNIN_375351 [Trichonephila inaurata madagascariensis]|uniref:Uncharacterized protein n=1 Tax=Trichonephila inaurata madagascariensis TaxID=2747483 RepID=A0A8X6WQQ8_9ARAC|nr:hypothetical protein TNIN_375351 [Trichonephila inaurata madagascariensis]
MRRTNVLPLPEQTSGELHGMSSKSIEHTSTPPLKVNYWEERARKKREMLEAAKAKNNPADQPSELPTTQAEETSSSLQSQAPSSSNKARPQARIPSSSTQGTSSSRPPPTRPSASHQNPPSITDTFSQVNDPEVCEMIGVIQQFITISKSGKPRAQKALELLDLLQIKFQF